MVDTVSPKYRSSIMSRVRSKNTVPELQIRTLVHGMGYRFRIHRRDLPGTPDLVFPSRRKVIFVHGCFWHRHGKCALSRIPKSRVDFWTTKLNANASRDVVNVKTLRKAGWKVLVVWECQIGRFDLEKRITTFLGAKGAGAC
jgi:DNA mismatch endonuclease (patch repair protein)